ARVTRPGLLGPSLRTFISDPPEKEQDLLREPAPDDWPVNDHNPGHFIFSVSLNNLQAIRSSVPHSRGLS
ncbi:MAG: hypothetical protein ACR2NN_15815, partial [Bryobacteraceae bacterium]